MDIIEKVLDYQKEQVKQIITQSRTAQKGATVFLGDSIVAGFDVKHYFGRNDIYNCGVNGATSDLLLHLFPHAIEAYAPSKLVIMIGTNDLNDRWQFDKLESAFNLFKLLTIMERKLPKTKIVVISALPIVDELQSGVCKDSKQIRLLMNEYKANVEECANATFIDIYNAFTQEGQLISTYTTDGLHLNKEGYDHMYPLIKEAFID